MLFSGNDYCPGMGTTIDSDDCLRDLIGFFLLGDGDTDPEYFDDYSPEALAFRGSRDREDLWGYGSDFDGLSDLGPEDYPFIDVE
jgi:hypothetical protein